MIVSKPKAKVRPQNMNEPMSDLSDSELMRKIVAEQDRDGFCVLYRRHESAAYSLALHVTGEKALAEESVQDAMVRVWKYVRSYDEQKGSVRSWLLRIVANQSMDRVATERKRRRNRAKDEELMQGRAITGSDVAEADVVQSEILGALRSALGRLPIAERRMVALYYGGGLSQEEIAETLAMPKRTVSHRLQRVLDQLREDLSRAGFAAVAPLLAGETLGQALCGGASVPATLSSRVFEGISKAHLLRASAVASRRSAHFVWPPAPLWLAVVALAVAGVGAGWYAQQAAGEPKSAAGNTATSAMPSMPATVAVPDPFYRKWTFSRGLPDELEVIKGKWRLDPGDEHHVSSLVPLQKNDDLLVLIRVLPPQCPLLLTAKVQILSESFANQLYLSDGQSLKPFRIWTNNVELYYSSRASLNVVMRVYLLGRWAVTYIDQHLVAVQEFANERSTDHLVSGFCNLTIEEIEVRELSHQELDQLRHPPEKLISSMLKGPIEKKGKPLRE